MLVTGNRWHSFFIGLTTTYDVAVVAALYLDLPLDHDEKLHGCGLSADGIMFLQGDVRKHVTWPTPALTTGSRVVLSFTMNDKALQLSIGNGRPMLMPYDGPPSVMNYPVCVCVPGNCYHLPEVEPCLCDRC